MKRVVRRGPRSSRADTKGRGGARTRERAAAALNARSLAAVRETRLTKGRRARRARRGRRNAPHRSFARAESENYQQLRAAEARASARLTERRRS